MHTPMFSFIMPCYKRQFLGKAFESILAQTYDDFELVVVNDASPENLYEVVNSISDPRLRYEENITNLGGRDLVACWNHCLQFARGEYVILATDDDVIEPTFLEDAVRLIKKYPEVDLLRQGVRKIDPVGEPLEYELFPKEYLTSSEFAYFWGCCGLISCISNFIFRRKTLVSQGGFVPFPHAHYSDVATALAMSRKGVACVQAYYLGFRMSDVNLSNRGEWSLALDQMKASNMFMQWLTGHLESIGTDFYTQRAFYGFREQYRYMISNLIQKVPKTRLQNIFTAVTRSNYLYKKEKVKLLLNYLF